MMEVWSVAVKAQMRDVLMVEYLAFWKVATMAVLWVIARVDLLVICLVES